MRGPVLEGDGDRHGRLVQAVLGEICYIFYFVV